MIFRLILRRFRVTPPQALHSSHTTVLSKGIIFPKKRKKNADFFQKHADISKIKRVLVLKVYFLKLRMCVHTHTHTQSRPRKSPSSLGIRVKDLTKIRNRGKFHHYRKCGCQGKNFQSFLYRFSIHEMAFFRGFFRSLLP